MHPDWSSDVILAGLFDSCLHAIFVLNERSEVVYRNQAFTDLANRQLDLARLVAAPPEAAAGQPVQASIHLGRLDESARDGKVAYLPLRDGMGRVSAVLGQILPGDVSPSAMPWADGMAEKLQELRRDLRRRFQWDQFIAQTPAMRRVLAQARLASATPAHVLLVGEAGTGKQTLARMIHGACSHANESFAALACDLLTPDELHHELSAWGLLGLADPAVANDRPGTIYFGTITAMPREQQAQLATALQGQSNLRVIGSCNMDPRKACQDGMVQEELYWQLANVVIEIPPLRDRRSEIPLLLQHRLEALRRDEGPRIDGGDDEVLDALMAYAWPGNVTQLFAVVDEAYAQCSRPRVELGDLSHAFRSRSELARMPSAAKPKPLPLDALLTGAERRLIQIALRDARGNVSKAAERLQVSRARLYRRMETLGLVGPEAPAEGFAPETDAHVTGEP